jgi:hypothetical protein
MGQYAPNVLLPNACKLVRLVSSSYFTKCCTEIEKDQAKSGKAEFAAGVSSVVGIWETARWESVYIDGENVKPASGRRQEIE